MPKQICWVSLSCQFSIQNKESLAPLPLRFFGGMPKVSSFLTASTFYIIFRVGCVSYEGNIIWCRDSLNLRAKCDQPYLPRREYEDGEDVAYEADAPHGQGEHAVAPVPRAAPHRHVLDHILGIRKKWRQFLVMTSFVGLIPDAKYEGLKRTILKNLKRKIFFQEKSLLCCPE